VVSGNATVFDEVLLAPVNATIAVGKDRLEILAHRLPTPATVSAEPFEATIDQSMQLLDRYFAAVAASFADRVTCALSGGYDSRLILAWLRRHGISPRVYVYGPPGDKDVELARAIAEGEGFALEVVDKDKQLAFAPGEFGAVAYDNFLASDGYTWSGIFTNGAERTQRASRVNGNAVALNGGGGEIWRNFFYLLDRTYTPREILWSFYSQFDPETCTAAFDQEDYFRELEGKLETLIGCPQPSLPRPLVEWLYHYFRCRAWDGRINNINNSYGYVALPFLEPTVTEHASVIPIAWKNHGAYEAELIRRADPRLASYQSGYGHDFSGPPPLVRRLTDYATYLRPPWLRRFAYRVKNRVRRPAEWPDYLQQEYRDAALPGGVQVMTELFQLDRVTDPAQAARILTLEYLVRQFDGRIRVDFHRSPLPGCKKCAA
jgi:asparagine synthase (glutamine-hydrolysing)